MEQSDANTQSHCKLKNSKYLNFSLIKFYSYRIAAFIAVEIEIPIPSKLLLGYEDCLKGSLHASLSIILHVLPHLHQEEPSLHLSNILTMSALLKGWSLYQLTLV